MKLSQLFEAPADPRALLTQVAGELGFKNPAFYDIDDEHSNAADVRAGIELFKLMVEKDGAIDVRSLLHNIEKSATVSEPTKEAFDALTGVEHTAFGQLPGVKAFTESARAMAVSAPACITSAKTCTVVYHLLAAINTAAITTMSTAFDPDELKYRSSIARACLKQLGITPMDM